ncbi:MAG: class I SAM-dependent methyltransferase [Bacteroidetes bacterium]|nr:class I SAM-dependent methyltransferase [Bacteroidota bacterium]
MISSSDKEYLHLLKLALTGSLYEESYWRYARLPAREEFRLQHPARALRALIKKTVLSLAKKEGLEVLRRGAADPAARDQGKDWPFVGLTMVGFKRLDNIAECVQRIAESKVQGDFVECGVWRGGSAMFMKAVADRCGLADRSVWLADSFEGMPKPVLAEDLTSPNYDLSTIGELRSSLEGVRQSFQQLGLLDDRVKFLKGWFKDTLPPAPIERISLLRLDGDLYESTRDALRALYHKVSPGGFTIVDDYFDWVPCRKAVDEFRAERNITSPIERIDWTGAFWQVGAYQTAGPRTPD